MLESRPITACAMKRTLLTEKALTLALASLPGWKKKGKAIERTIEFETYADGLDFAVRVGRRADRDNHHPDLVVGYCRVTVRWTTHDAGGPTALDIAGARMADEEERF